MMRQVAKKIRLPNKKIVLRSNALTTLVIINRPLTTNSNGYDLRVWHLCHALAQHQKLVLLTLPLSQLDASNHADIHPEEIFSDVLMTASLARFKPSFRRYFRLNEDCFFSWGYPEFQQSVVDQIENICNEHDIEKIIVFGSNLAGLIRLFCGKKKILLDVCDSVALTMERETILLEGRLDLLGRLKRKLMHERWKALEGRTPVWFDHVVTINRMDTETIRKLSGGKTNLSTVPNGVDPVLEHSYQEGPCKRKGVAFWGNLSFLPNRDAVNFFYWEVYLPYLKPAGIELCIIGRDPEPWLLKAAQQDEKIRLTGFVKDLRELLIEYPIMVNPMRIGSGMKNKILEAYAIGLAVVSTPLGIESIEGAVAGENYMEAETPSRFFEAILALIGNEEMRIGILRSAREIILKKYTWNIVGSKWVDLVNSV